MDHAEQAVRALPPFLQRRMAHLVMRGWEIKCNQMRPWAFSEAQPSFSWTARYNRIADEASYPYDYMTTYSAPTLLTLLEQPDVASEAAAPCADLELLLR